MKIIPFKKQRGYYIYYETNQEMKNYMLAEGEMGRMPERGRRSETIKRDTAVVKNYKKALRKKKSLRPKSAFANPAYVAGGLVAAMVLIYGVRSAVQYQGNQKMQEVFQQQEMTDEPPVQTEGETVEAEQEEPVAVVADAMAAPEQSAEELHQRGKAAVQAKDYQNALDDLLLAGQQGHADAQTMAGYVYLKWKQDKAQAFYWYSLAAQQNNALAQLYLGEAYRTGSGVAQDYAAAAQWYRQAAEQGNANAQNSLALMYVNGMGVEKDYQAALQWSQKAAAQNHTKAKEMAQWLEQQIVNEKLKKALEADMAEDYTTALQLYSELAEQGVATAQYNVGLMHYHGNGTAKDLEQALLWCQKAAEQGYEKAKKTVERVQGELEDIKFADVVKVYKEAYNSDDRDKFEHALQTLKCAKENGYTNAQKKIEDLASRMDLKGKLNVFAPITSIFRHFKSC